MTLGYLSDSNGIKIGDMACRQAMAVGKKDQSRELQGGQEIADFLGLPVATADRWEESGMPVHRGGRYVYAMPGELNRWFAQGSHSRAPIHITTGSEDLAADLKHALSEARQKRKPARRTS